VNETGELITALGGIKVKLVDNGVGTTVTILDLVAVWEGEDASVAVSVTVNA
jgi:hypothetical protein